MHTAQITAVAVDPGERFIITASEDKTARIWDLSTGIPIGVLRPPIADDDRWPEEGELYAVAISPDGATVALAGSTRLAGDGRTFGVWLYDINSRRIIKSVGDFDETILSLAFHPTRPELAVGLSYSSSDTQGSLLKVINTETDLEVQLDDSTIDRDVYSVEYSSNGRLLVSSWNGTIRIYGDDYSLQSMVTVGSGARPSSARFSPSGFHVAIAYSDEQRVELRDASDLGMLKVYTDEVVNRSTDQRPDLSNVVWLNETTVCGGGRLRNKDGSKNVVRCWGGQHNGSEGFPIVSNVITDLQRLSGDRVVVTSAAPAWAIHDGEGVVDPKVKRDSPLLNFSNPRFRLLINDKGNELTLSDLMISPGEFVTINYDLNTGQLRQGRAPGAATERSSVEGIYVIQDETDPYPLLNGRSLTSFDEDNRMETFALFDNKPVREGDPSPHIARFDYRVAVGGSRTLCIYPFSVDPSMMGDFVCSEELPGKVYRVNWSGDGHVIVAALSDGTIRWFRSDTAEPLITLYIKPNHIRNSIEKTLDLETPRTFEPDFRWVAWTLSGFYDSSPNGEGLAVWHYNSKAPDGSAQTSTTTPLSVLRSQYNRPDAIQLMLTDFRENTSITSPQCEELAPEPPILEGVTSTLTHAGDGVWLSLISRKICSESDDVHTIVVQAQGGGTRQFRADYLATNSEPVSDDPLATRYRLFLAPELLPKQDSTLIIFVSSNMDGPSTSTKLQWTGSPEQPSDGPRLFVLSVGIDEPSKHILYADEDARRFSNFWKRYSHSTYEKNPYIKTLTNGAATREAILAELRSISKIADRPTDTMIFFVAGHGVNVNNRFYVKTMTSRQRENELDDYYYWLKGEDIIDALVSIEAGRKFLFIDVCHSGLLKDEIPSRARGDIHQFYKSVTTSDPTTVIVTASSSFGYAYENEQRWGGGAFTFAILQGLCGAAQREESKSKNIMVIDLHVYLSDYFALDPDLAQLQTPVIITQLDESETPWRNPLIVAPSETKQCPY